MEEEELRRLVRRVLSQLGERNGSVTLHVRSGRVYKAEYRYFDKEDALYEVTATAA